MCAAPKGGGMWIAGNDFPGENVAYMVSCSFTQNVADYGGAMYADNYAIANLNACSFTSNAAKGGGGALAADDASSLQLSGCTFTGNGVFSDNDPPLVQLPFLRALCQPRNNLEAQRCMHGRRQGGPSPLASTSTSLPGRRGRLLWCR